MLKRLLVGLLVLNVSGLCATMLSFAQEYESEEIWEFTFGKVTRISKDQITIMEYNFEQEKEMEGVYEVGEATEFLNVDGLSGFRVNDEVEIEFKPVNGKNVIMAIAKDEIEDLEEFPNDFQFEDMMEESEEPISG